LKARNELFIIKSIVTDSLFWLISLFAISVTLIFYFSGTAFADQLSEGHNYIVTISDSVGTADHLK